MSSENFPVMLTRLIDIFIKQMPFVRLLNLEVLEFTATQLTVKFAKEPQLIGNFMHNILHGGAIASVLDTIGGMQAIAAQLARNPSLNLEEQDNKVAKAATVNLNINYLRPGQSDAFTATARLIRAGRQFTVVDLTLHSKEGELLACGNGTFVVGS